MSRSPLEDEILSALQDSPREAVAGWTLRGVVEQAGVDATESEFEAACEALVEERAVEVDEDGTARRYRLRPGHDLD